MAIHNTSCGSPAPSVSTLPWHLETKNKETAEGTSILYSPPGTEAMSPLNVAGRWNMDKGDLCDFWAHRAYHLSLPSMQPSRFFTALRSSVTPWRGQPLTRITHGATEKECPHSHRGDSSPSENGCSTVYSGQHSTPPSFSFLTHKKRLARGCPDILEEQRIA